MPDETINTDVSASAPALVEPVVTEPSIVADPEPVAVVEPVIVATPTEPVVETVAEPSIVSEVQVAPEPEPPVLATVEAPTPVVAEDTQAPEQIAETVQPSVLAPVGDLGLTPQLPVNEALTPENTPEKQPLEQPSVPAVLAPEPAPEPARAGIPLKNIARELLVKARGSIQFRKRKKLDRIMGLFAKQASITNDDAEKLLHISDATACRYLGILEKEGKVKQFGTAGRWVSYVKAG